MPAANVPRGAGGHRSDIALLAILLGLWVVPWGALSLASAVAGGQPHVSPVEFLSPDRIAAELHHDGGSVVWWHLVGAHGPIRPAVFWAVLALLAAVPALAVAAAVLPLGGRLPGRGRMAGRGLVLTTRWATSLDLLALRARRGRPGRLLVGRGAGGFLAAKPETSVLVVGPTRSGKTSALIIPNLLEWRGPAVVTSTKSEIVDLTAGHRQRAGPVHVYDPTGEISGRFTATTWSPASGCTDLDHAWRVASWLCTGLQQSGARSDNDWTHWAESGKLLIAPLLFCAHATPGRSVVDVRDWIHGFDLATPMALLADLAEEGGERGEDAVRAVGMLTSVDQRPEKERGTVFSTVMRIFSPFNERRVAASAAASRFDPDTLLRQGGTLYLCTPGQAPERVAGLFVGILMTVVTRAYALGAGMPRGRLHPELGLFLDELANVVPIEDLPSLASQGAGRGVILMSIVQDLSQLRTRYGGDRANSILNNHGATMVLPGLTDPETCEVVARMVGRGRHTDVSVSRQPQGVNRSFSVRHDHIATPDALRQLREGRAVLLHRGRPPAVVRLRPWFADRRWRRLARRRHLRGADWVREDRRRTAAP